MNRERTEQHYRELHLERIEEFHEIEAERLALFREADKLQEPGELPDYRKGGSRTKAEIDAELTETYRAMDRLAYATGFERYVLDWHPQGFEDVEPDHPTWRGFASEGYEHARVLDEELGLHLEPGDSVRAIAEVKFGLEWGAAFPRAEPSVAELVPWVQAALAVRSLWIRWWNQHNGGGGGEYNAPPTLEAYFTPPHFVEYEGDSVTACWYADDLPAREGPSSWGPRNIRRISFYTNEAGEGIVQWDDTNIVFPGMVDRMLGNPKHLPDPL